MARIRSASVRAGLALVAVGCGGPLDGFGTQQLTFRVVGDQAELSLSGDGCTLGAGVTATLNEAPMTVVDLGGTRPGLRGCDPYPTFAARLPPAPDALRFVVEDGSTTLTLVASHPHVAPTLAFVEPGRTEEGAVVLRPADRFVLEASEPLVGEVSFTIVQPARVCASGNFLMRSRHQRTLEGWLPRYGLCPGRWEARANFPTDGCSCSVEICDCPTRFATAPFVLEEPEPAPAPTEGEPPVGEVAP